MLPLVSAEQPVPLAQRARRVPVGVWLSLVVLVVIVLAAALADQLAPHSPYQQSLARRLIPPAWEPDGDVRFLLGTDHLGRDVLSRMLYGARVSLSLAIFAVIIGTLLGCLLGLVAGYFGGAVDEVIGAVADIQLAFPFVLLAIAVIAVVGPGYLTLVVLVGISGWVTYTRVSRSLVLSLREREFVTAVRVLGGSDVRILFKHILPNTLSAIVAVATIDLARVIVLESSLSFLGFGVQPPEPSWGGMLGEGRLFLDSGAWWISTFPGLAIVLTTIAVSRAGDWLHDVLDPTAHAHQ
ncbi:MAG: ABC transporter permease [Chloroflexi bacterium]|nr:ABC transporter permease [Chloroflexota bacterium]